MHRDHEYIRVLAYQLWEARGRPEGSADEDWQEAERQLAAATQTADEPQMKLRAPAPVRTPATPRGRAAPRAPAPNTDGNHAGKKQEPGWSGTS